MPCADPEGVTRAPPLKNHKAIGFLSNTGPDPMEHHKATKLAFHSMLVYHRPASERPFKWRSAGGPMIARYKCYLDRFP